MLLGDGSGLHGWGVKGLLGGKRALLSGCFGMGEGADERRGCTFCKGKDRKQVVSSGKGTKNEGECCKAVVGDGLDGEFCCNCGVWERF